MIAIVSARGVNPDDMPDNFFYVGRAYGRWQESPLHNAFPIVHDNQRQQNRRTYKEWLWEVMQDTTSKQRQALDAITAKAQEGTAILLCWDSVNPLHADIVKAAAEWLLRQEVDHA